MVTEWNILGNIRLDQRQRRHYIIAGRKTVAVNWFGWNLPPMQLADWLLVEVGLLLIGLTKISFVKNWF
jgi:hypothetical protein